MEQEIVSGGHAAQRLTPRKSPTFEQGQTTREPCDALRLWTALCAGRLRFAEVVETDERYIALLEERAGRAVPLEPRQRQVLERLLRGQSGKVISIELGLSSSTVSGELHGALVSLGLAPRVARCPVLLFQVFAAATSGRALSASFERIGSEHLVLSAARPQRHAFQRLSRAEFEIATLYLGGRNYSEIAATRRTRPRTISNQIASIFRKFAVSGRASLITTLIADEGANPSSRGRES